MLITRTVSGFYASKEVYSTVRGKRVLVNADREPYVGRTVAEVIIQAYSNAVVRRMRAALSSKMSVSK